MEVGVKHKTSPLLEAQSPWLTELPLVGYSILRFSIKNRDMQYGISLTVRTPSSCMFTEKYYNWKILKACPSQRIGSSSLKKSVTRGTALSKNVNFTFWVVTHSSMHLR